MDENQLKHYLMGGMFTGIYNPKKTDDLSAGSSWKIGRPVKVRANIQPAPIIGSRYDGQHRFNSDEISGWFPEEDIDGLEIVNEWLPDEDAPKLPQYMYRMTYTKREKLKPNFGKGYGKTPLPLVVGRDYKIDMDDYVLNELCDPKPCLLEKAVWNGEQVVDWEILYKE